MVQMTAPISIIGMVKISLERRVVAGKLFAGLNIPSRDIVWFLMIETRYFQHIWGKRVIEKSGVVKAKDIVLTQFAQISVLEKGFLTVTGELGNL